MGKRVQNSPTAPTGISSHAGKQRAQVKKCCEGQVPLNIFGRHAENLTTAHAARYLRPERITNVRGSRRLVLQILAVVGAGMDKIRRESFDDGCLAKSVVVSRLLSISISEQNRPPVPASVLTRSPNNVIVCSNQADASNLPATAFRSTRLLRFRSKDLATKLSGFRLRCRVDSGILA